LIRAHRSTAIVLDENGVLARPALARRVRTTQNADCLGDLALAGARRARVAFKPSHRGTVRLVRAMQDAIAKETSADIDEIMKCWRTDIRFFSSIAFSS
jgi:hypothetical protein